MFRQAEVVGSGGINKSPSIYMLINVRMTLHMPRSFLIRTLDEFAAEAVIYYQAGFNLAITEWIFPNSGLLPPP